MTIQMWLRPVGLELVDKRTAAFLEWHTMSTAVLQMAQT